VQKRLSRLSRRSLVGVIAGLAFAAAAGVGLAQITSSEPSGAASAVSTTSASTGTQSNSTGEENDEAGDSNDDMLDFEQGDDNGTTSSAQQQTQSNAVTSTFGQEQETDAEGAGQEKVEVCHMTGSGKPHTIDIARPAVAAHVAHGDTEGACAATTTAAAVTTSAQTTTTARVKKPKHEHSSTHISSSHASQHVSHSSSTHVSHGDSNHTSHAHPSHASHGNSEASHGNSGGHGNGHNK
jgi:hypothetical protein